MARSVEALVKPDMLAWGRESMGFSLEEAANKLRLRLERLVELEEGSRRPTVFLLEKMAEVYKRPTAVFYLPEPPKEPDLPHDFRRAEREGRPSYSPPLRLELRKSRYRREIAIDLLAEMDEDMQRFEETISIGEDPDDVASFIRGMLNIRTDEQFDWKNDHAALKDWKNAIEALGVLVFETSRYSGIPTSDMRGVSLAADLLPIILLNSKDAVRGRIFTLLHEFVHLLLHSGGICNTEERSKPSNLDERTEIFCNRVSGTILVPTDVLLKQDIVIAKEDKYEWTDRELGTLGNRFRVSREVILRRLLTLERTNAAFYRKKRAEFLQQYEQQQGSPSDGGAPYYRLVIRDNGLAYTRLVMEAYCRRHITTCDAADYLGAKIKHLRSIEQTVMRTPSL